MLLSGAAVGSLGMQPRPSRPAGIWHAKAGQETQIGPRLYWLWWACVACPPRGRDASMVPVR